MIAPPSEPVELDRVILGAMTRALVKLGMKSVGGAAAGSRRRVRCTSD
jgi:hypothetical protein